MRDLLDIIAEATKTKEPVTIDLSIEEPTSHGELTTAAPDAATPAAVEPPGRQAGAAKTRASIKAPVDPVRTMRHMADLMATGAQDEISDDEAARRAGLGGADMTDGAEPIPTTPQNLPAIVSRAVAATGDHIVPEWHQVRHLPGYMQTAIRAMGRQVFGQFTNTPIEDIQVLATLVNSDAEVNGMANWIRHNGAKDDQATMDFEQSIPGYGAQVQVWNSLGYTFLLVKDFAGNYIYAWPGGRGVHVGHTDFQRLR